MNDPSYIVVLERQQELDPALVVPLCTAAGVHRTDAVRMVRRQRGLLHARLSENAAICIAAGLIEAGIEATACPEGDFPAPPRPLNASRMTVGDAGIEVGVLKSVRGVGPAPWEDIRLVLAGIVQAADDPGLDTFDAGAVHGDKQPVDFVKLIRASYEPRSQRCFPLAAHLAEASSHLHEAATVAPPFASGVTSGRPHSQPVKRSVQRMRRFDDLAPAEIAGPRGVLLVAAGERLIRHEAGVYAKHKQAAAPATWLRGFHRLARAIVLGSLDARIPPETLAFADGADSHVYVYDDMESIHDHLRWWWGK